MFLKQVLLNYRNAVFCYFFAALEEGKGDKNDGNDFEILLYFDVVVVAE